MDWDNKVRGHKSVVYTEMCILQHFLKHVYTVQDKVFSTLLSIFIVYMTPKTNTDAGLEEYKNAQGQEKDTFLGVQAHCLLMEYLQKMFSFSKHLSNEWM